MLRQRMYKALDELDIDAKFSYVFEDHDPMDGLPAYLDAEIYKPYSDLYFVIAYDQPSEPVIRENLKRNFPAQEKFLNERRIVQLIIHGSDEFCANEPSAILVFDSVIRPWIQMEFKKDISDELVSIDRVLLLTELYRYEIIEGEDRYSIHIEWAMKLTDRSNGRVYKSTRGQEIIFLIEDKKVKDFFPFTEYYISGEDLGVSV